MHASTRATALSKYSSLRLLPAIVMATALTGSLPAAPVDDAADEIKNFGQVSPNYYRGGQPDRAGFYTLKRLGVKTVINLRQDAERDEPALVRETKMAYFNIPLTTGRPATAEQTDYFLKLVNDPANLPVYVHCAGGKHRAGEMTAIYRITHDSWSADQAYREMQRYKFDTFPFHSSLKNYVYRYYDMFQQSLMAGTRSTAPGTTSPVDSAAAPAAAGTALGGGRK